MILGKLGNSNFAVRISDELPEELREELVRFLPFSGKAHRSRVAGNMFYVATPIVVEPSQNTSPVNDIAPGTWIFWHNRQFLECITGPINPEDTSVTVVGQTAEGVHDLLAEAQRPESSLDLALDMERLDPSDTLAPEVPLRGSYDEQRMIKVLRQLSTDYWSTKPTFISEVEQRIGVMQPAGSLMLLEAIASRHHEALWYAYIKRDEYERQSFADTLDLLVTSFVQQNKETLALKGSLFDELEDLSLLLEHFSASGVHEASKRLIQIFGAIAHWGDLEMPWLRLAETFKK